MIRLAFLLVTVLGGLIAIGAFYVVRGDGSAPAPTEIAQPEPEQPAPEQEPPVEDNYYFLRDLTLGGDGITLVLFNIGTNRETVVVRDMQAIMDARDVANVGMMGGTDTFALYRDSISASGSFLAVYRDDQVIESIVCANFDCVNMTNYFESGQISVDYGGLLDAAQPFQRIEDSFDSYDDYLATIDAIAQDTNYMLLDARPEGPFPLEQQIARMELALPTLITPADATFDPNVTSALARSIVEPLLPESAQISEVVFTTAGQGLVADGDSGTPVLAGGAPIAFPVVKFTSVTVSVEGAATLSEAALDSLSDQALQRTDYQAAFEAFVTERLQSSCVDCFTVKMNGDFYDEATIIASEPEGYSLDYYDLREAP